MNLDPTTFDFILTFGGTLIGALAYWLFNTKIKTHPDYDVISEMAYRIVTAAQQMYKEDNAKKFAYATKQLSDFLKAKGWNISPDLIETFIEYAVFLMKRSA